MEQAAAKERGKKADTPSSKMLICAKSEKLGSGGSHQLSWQHCCPHILLLDGCVVAINLLEMGMPLVGWMSKGDRRRLGISVY